VTFRCANKKRRREDIVNDSPMALMRFGQSSFAFALFPDNHGSRIVFSPAWKAKAICLDTREVAWYFPF
jgi:hypothetical protein